MKRWGIIWGIVCGCSGALTQGEVCDRAAAALCLKRDACTGEDDADACYDELMRAWCAAGCDRPAAASHADVDRCIEEIEVAPCDGEGLTVPSSCKT